MITRAAANSGLATISAQAAALLACRVGSVICASVSRSWRRMVDLWWFVSCICLFSRACRSIVPRSIVALYALPPFIQSAFDLGLITPIGRGVVYNIHPQIILSNHTAFEIVRVLIPLPMTQPLRPLVVRILQVYRHWYCTPLPHVLHSFADG